MKKTAIKLASTSAVFAIATVIIITFLFSAETLTDYQIFGSVTVTIILSVMSALFLYLTVWVIKNPSQMEAE